MLRPAIPSVEQRVTAKPQPKPGVRRPAARPPKPDTQPQLDFLPLAPPAARKLINSSAELYARIRRIDEGSLESVAPQSPARALMGRLERGLSGGQA